jgi:hypothetical protein
MGQNEAMSLIEAACGIRATRQEDGEPGWRFKIRKPLLMTTG